jgi:glucuronate isomerase
VNPASGNRPASFLDANFLLHSATARRLYERHAKSQPILDYHCHLPPQEIAENRRFSNLTELWLEGDHYKWRAMRAHGIAERYCTGDAAAHEKFAAWASTVPACLRNPLYHWTHLELQRYFDIHELLDGGSARAIWDRVTAQLAAEPLDAHGILAKFDVRVLCTTDDPADDLAHHASIARSSLGTRVYPAFRPDRALDVDDAQAFNAWVDRLARSADTDIVRLPHLLDALGRRHEAFHEAGARLSDHGLDRCHAADCTEAEAAAIFDKVRSAGSVGATDRDKFASYLMLFFGHLDAAKGWTKQLHLGAYRAVNTRATRAIGRDTGFDSIGDARQVDSLGRYLDRLEQQRALPKMIVYNVNPSENYAFATMIGNFQDGQMPGKIQFGSGWWYLDQKAGIEWQLDALSNTGLLAHFVGMTTDSRSFMSYPRHEYFRRVLCNLIGAEVERGELPDHDDLTGRVIEDVCYRNAVRHFGFPQPAHSS